MLTLTKVQVWKYKSIEDSTLVDVANGVTVLVGKNESGKTAFLEALHKAMPLGSAKFDYVSDYPRKDLVRYRPQHELKNYQKVVELTFQIEKALADKINKELFDGAGIVTAGSTFTRTTTIGKPGRGAPGKTPFVVAVQTDPEHPASVLRMRMKVLRNVGRKGLQAWFSRGFVEGSTVLTDGWDAYKFRNRSGSLTTFA